MEDKFNLMISNLYGKMKKLPYEILSIKINKETNFFSFEFDGDKIQIYIGNNSKYYVLWINNVQIGIEHIMAKSILDLIYPMSKELVEKREKNVINKLAMIYNKLMEKYNN